MPRCRQPSKKNLTLHLTSETDICQFCQRGPDHDNLSLGPIYSKDGINAHKNCLYFGAGLVQQQNAGTGDDNDDLEGADEMFFFPIASIQKELKRCTKLKCMFCKKPFASAGCINKKCKRIYHYPCGLENGILFHFREFYSACAEHQDKQEIHTCEVDMVCQICQDDIDGNADGHGVPSYHQVYCPSCKRWLHRRCLQLWAYKAGVHHLRCPMCNNKDEFTDEMFRLGFELPDRDAEWEREGMYAEQERGTYLRCSAELCQLGDRDFSTKTGMKELIACVVCGEFAIHRQCIDQYSFALSNSSVDDWWCATCEGVELKLEAQRQVQEWYRQRAIARSQGLDVEDIVFCEKIEDCVGPLAGRITEYEAPRASSVASIVSIASTAPSSSVQPPSRKKARTSFDGPHLSPQSSSSTQLPKEKSPIKPQRSTFFDSLKSPPDHVMNGSKKKAAAADSGKKSNETGGRRSTSSANNSKKAPSSSSVVDRSASSLSSNNCNILPSPKSPPPPATAPTVSRTIPALMPIEAKKFYPLFGAVKKPTADVSITSEPAEDAAAAVVEDFGPSHMVGSPKVDKAKFKRMLTSMNNGKIPVVRVAPIDDTVTIN